MLPTKVFAKAGLDIVTSAMCKHQLRFGLNVQFSALVHNFNNIFSNEHLYRAGRAINSLPSQILERNLMDRASYFEEINSLTSPLQLLADQLDTVIQARTNDLREPIDVYLDFADQLTQLDSDTAKTRAAFIRMQCGGIDTEAFFEQHRESWGIPKFEEDLLSVDDFKNGFLFTFRDHSTSWCEDGEAREWLFNSVEARFVRHYQFWACDQGPEEILLSTSGDYKNIMWTIVKDYQDYSALASPIFTKQDLQDFYKNFDEQNGDYDKEDLLEIIEENPNW